MFDFTGTYTDQYELVMAQIYFMQGQVHERAIFDFFFRKLPFQGGYAIFAGLEDLLEILEQFHFSKTDIDYLHQQGFHSDFLEYLKHLRFQGNIYACNEGEVIFPICPIVSVEATIIEAQLLETLILNLLNFQTLIATKASRMRSVAGNHQLIDFGLRRAQGPGGYYASRAAMIGGFHATSNVRAGRDYRIPVAGTMAHSFVQSYDDELTAFRDFAAGRPHDCVLLVDTYNTLKSGIPHAITVAKEMEERGEQLKGVRLDSGDLAYLSKQSRTMLDAAGLHYVKIVVSNQLDEPVIKSLLDQQAPIDAFGVGTHLVTGHPDAALDGVYKLAWSHHKPRMKLSESIAKISLPYKKQVYRVFDADDCFLGADVISLAEEDDASMMHHPFEPLKSFNIEHYTKKPLLHTMIENGKKTSKPKQIAEIAKYCQSRLALLPEEYKRFNNPHIYKVGISSELKNKRDQLIEEHRQIRSKNS